MLMNLPQDHRSVWLLGIVLVGGFIAGLLSWRLVERPAMKAARHHITRMM
jgi:peptidoglycan/LPS O-acetylase OafA/YrhL